MNRRNVYFNTVFLIFTIFSPVYFYIDILIYSLYIPISFLFFFSVLLAYRDLRLSIDDDFISTDFIKLLPKVTIAIVESKGVIAF